MDEYDGMPGFDRTKAEAEGISRSQGEGAASDRAELWPSGAEEFL